MVVWFVGGFVDWLDQLVRWLVCLLFGCLFGWLGWLVSLLIGQERNGTKRKNIEHKEGDTSKSESDNINKVRKRKEGKQLTLEIRRVQRDEFDTTDWET